MKDTGTFICPPTPGPNDSDIIGCGARITVEIAVDGTVDCPECGIDFPASEPGVRVSTPSTNLKGLVMALLIAASVATPALAYDHPNRALTPGAVVPVTIEQVCTPGYARSARHPYDGAWRRLRVRMFRAYGIPHKQWRQYTVDHLVNISIGGAPFNEANLWPQPKAEAKVKDRTEDRLHAEVCAGVLAIDIAQQELERDWTTAR